LEPSSLRRATSWRDLRQLLLYVSPERGRPIAMGSDAGRSSRQVTVDRFRANASIGYAHQGVGLPAITSAPERTSCRERIGLVRISGNEKQFLSSRGQNEPAVRVAIHRAYAWSGLRPVQTATISSSTELRLRITETASGARSCDPRQLPDPPGCVFAIEATADISNLPPRSGQLSA